MSPNSGGIVVYVRLIGQIQAWTASNETILPMARKSRALLAALALSGPEPVSRRFLAELLWSQRNEDVALASLREQLQMLLAALEPGSKDILLVTRDHLALDSGAVWVDVAEVMRATADQPEALTLLDGELLECLDGTDPGYDIFLTEQRHALDGHAWNVAAAVLRARTEPDAVITAARRLLRMDATDQGGWRSLMSAYAECGERGMAIQAYDQCRAMLARVFGTTPSGETRQLPMAIRGPATIPRWKH